MIKPIIVVKMPCSKLLYIIQVKGFLIKLGYNFLALPDIKVFGHLQRCFLLASLFFTARLFLFSISLLFVCK